MTPSSLNESLQDLIDLAEDELINSIRTHQSRLVKEVLRLVNRQRSGLILDENERIVVAGKQGTENRKRLASIRAQLDKLANTKFIRSAIDTYVIAYTEIEKIYAEYYSAVSKKFTRTPVKEMAKGARQRISEILIGGLNSDMKRPVDNILNLALEGSLLTDLEDQLEDTTTELQKKGRKTTIKRRGHFERYVNNQVLANATGERHKVRDSLHGFSGAITHAVTAQLELEWIYYGGPRDGANRKFCKERARGYYHISEVMYWVNSVKWDGKNPIINENNYLEVRCGFGGRHIWLLVPIEDVPKKYIDRAKRLGFYKG